MSRAATGEGVVDAVHVHRVVVPLERPMRSGIHVIDTMHNVIVQVTAGGHVGIGYTFAFREAEARAVMALISGLAHVVVGTDPDHVRATWAAMWRHIDFVGHMGLAVMGLAALDTAVWDVRARRHGLPLYRLLGAREVQHPVYASAGSLHLGVDELVDEASAACRDGFAGYKLRVGGATLAGDIARVEAVRDAVGQGFPLMADANQAWDRPTARRAVQELARFDLAWLEEPLPADDLEGLGDLRQRGRVPIAAGETAYGHRGCLELLDARGVDVLQPDLMRCGGVTEMLIVASLAASRRVPVSTHLFTETNAHVMSAVPTGTLIEYIPGWFDHLFGPPAIQDGSIRPGESPGIGVSLEDGLLANHGVDHVVVECPTSHGY